MKKLAVVDKNNCAGCESCERACALAFYKEDNPDYACIHFQDLGNGKFKNLTCIQCGKCARVCPQHAITQNPKGVYMPQFKALFDAMPSLPPATQVLFAISNFVQTRWYVLIICIFLIVIGLRFLFKVPAVRYGLDKLKVHLPKFGKMNKVIYTAHFARTLSSLYSSGIPIVTSLEIARKTIGNLYIDKQFDEVIARVKAGDTLSDSLEKVDGFIKKLTSAMHVGEETGSLDSMLNSTADDLDYEAEMTTTRMVTFLEPIMIVIMAVIVGFIMIAVITPIYQSYSSIGANS